MGDALRDRATRRAALSAGATLPTQPFPSLAIALSALLLRRWGHDTSRCDASFHDGMLKDARALGDRVGTNGRPIDWKFATEEDNRVDVLLVGGHSSAASAPALRGSMDWSTCS